MSEPHVVNAFLNLYLEENLGGPARAVEHYQALFPGHDALIAELYERCRRQSDGAAVDSRIGPFEIVREIGRGGQGVVYLAKDTRLERPVALKVLTGLRAMTPNALDRLLREARIASRLDHPGICAVYEASVDAGTPYIAMQYVEGTTLAKRIATTRSRLSSGGASKPPSSMVSFDEGAMNEPAKSASPNGTSSLDRKDLDQIVGAFEKVARALHAAHEVGIVHRDIKPGNIMITPAEEPVLLDFGLAQDDSDGSGPSLTQTGDVFGTPAYMSPEQITGHRVRIDRRSDVYSLGVTLYECLTMKRPFEAPTRESLYQAILSKEPEGARKLNRQISSDLEVVLQCAMSKDRDKRYQTAADFAEDLRRARADEPVLAKKVGILGRAWRWSKRWPAAAALVGALALGIPSIAGLGVWYWTHRDDVRAQERARREELLEDALETGFYELHEASVSRAVVAFEKALSLDAGSAEAVVGLALARGKRDLPDALQAALGVINEGERSVADPRVLARTKADILTKLGRKAEAAVALESAPKIEGPLMWFLEGTRALDAGDSVRGSDPRAQPRFREAAGHLTRAVSGNARARRAYHFQLAHAIGHCDPPERDSALAIADALEGLWPTSPRTWRWIGHVMTDVDPGRSLAAYREAIRLNPGRAHCYVDLGCGYAQQGMMDEAIAEFREAIRLDPKDSQAHAFLGFALASQGRTEEAIAEFREAIRLDPKSSRPHAALGEVLKNQGKQEEAIAEFREAIRLDGEDASARCSLGAALVNHGKHEEAIAEYREAIRLNPNDVGTRSRLGYAFARQGKWDEAIAEYREAVRLNPKDARTHGSLGAALANQDKTDEAIAEHREAIRLDPKYGLAHINLGIALSNQGKLEEAIAEFREAIRIEPDRVVAHHKLAATLHKNRDLAEAVAVQAKVLRLMNGADMDGVKLVEMQDDLDRYRDALDAAESRPSQPETRK